MPTEITAAQGRLVTGRCVYHDCGLALIPHSDDSLDSIMDAWYCPGWPDDPGLKRLQQEDRELARVHPGPWSMQPEEVQQRRTEIAARTLVLHGRCRDSWVLTVPDAR